MAGLRRWAPGLLWVLAGVVQAAPAEGCRVHAAAVMADRQAVVVDVRTSVQAARVWIPGAPRFSLEGLPAQALIQASSSVVLIGTGKDTATLMRRCARLQEQGLPQVRVLEGGLPAWDRAGGEVAGAVSSLGRPLLLEVSEVGAAIRDGGARLLFVGAHPTAAWKASGASFTQVAQTGAPRAALQRAARQGSGAIVIVLSPDQELEPWRNAAGVLALADPLFFIEDVTRYDTWLREQEAIAATAAQPRAASCDR